MVAPVSNSPADGFHLPVTFGQNDVVTDNNVGSAGLQITAIGNASTLAYQTAGKYGTVLRLTTAATADGDGEAVHSFPDGLVVTPGTWFKARVRYPVELASLNFRVGLDDSVTATSPTVGIWFDSDAGVLSCQVDSADHGDESELVTGHPDLTSGTTAVVGEWLDLEWVASGRENAQGGPDEVDFYINSHHVAKVKCNIDDDEEVELKLAAWQDSGSTDAVTFEVAYMELYIPRLG